MKIYKINRRNIRS